MDLSGKGGSEGTLTDLVFKVKTWHNVSLFCKVLDGAMFLVGNIDKREAKVVYYYWAQCCCIAIMCWI